MRFLRGCVWAFSLWLVCLPGCSSVHVDVAPTLDWTTLSDVVLQETTPDPWLLTPAIRQELQQMGLRVLEPGSSQPDLIIRFFFKEGPDLDANGNLSTRLQSLHVQFIDPENQNVVAVSDYFYPEQSSRPEAGVAIAFERLRETIQGRAAKPVPTVAAPVLSEATAPAPAEIPPVPQPQPDEPPRPAPETQRSPVVKVSSPEVTVASKPQVVKPLEKPLVPITDKAKVPEVETKTESPWVPKFHSWGFENWGEQRDDGY